MRSKGPFLPPLTIDGDLISMAFRKAIQKGTMFQVIPIRDTDNNINAIHATAESEGIPAAELLRKITRAYTKKAGFAVDDLEIKAGKKKRAELAEAVPKPKKKRASKAKVKA